MKYVERQPYPTIEFDRAPCLRSSSARPLKAIVHHAFALGAATGFGLALLAVLVWVATTA